MEIIKERSIYIDASKNYIYLEGWSPLAASFRATFKTLRVFLSPWFSPPLAPPVALFQLCLPRRFILS